MSYIINKTDGSTLVEIIDGDRNTKASNLTLIGKNVSGFGEVLNENLIKLLENFADVQSPDAASGSNALTGQLWFDTSLNSLKVYTGEEWKTVGSATVADSPPNTLRTGDFWYDTSKNQIFFNTGSKNELVAPSYSSSQLKSGIEVVTVPDLAGNPYVVIALYISNILIGVFSKAAFTPKSAELSTLLPDYTSPTIAVGFNLAGFSNANDFKFRATATNADALGGTVADLFVRKDESSIISSDLYITDGIHIGPITSSLNLSSTNGNATIGNAADNFPLTITVKATGDLQTAISIDPTTEILSIYPSRPTSTLQVGGSVIIAGDLAVRGTTTTITTNNLIVKDKLVEINKPETGTVTDLLASGGGLSLKGTTDHTIIWDNDKAVILNLGVSSTTDTWTTSEHIDIDAPDGKLFINGVEVLNGNTLSSAIVSAPGLSSFGTQSEINIGVDNDNQVLRITDNTISTLVGNTDLELSPAGTGNVALIGSPRITGLAAPEDDNDATRKVYVDRLSKLKPLGLAMDITDLTDADIVDILDNILPIDDYLEGTVVKIATSRQVASTVDYTPTINKTTVEVTANDASTYSVLRDVNIPTATITAPTITVVRDYLWYQIQDVSTVLTWVNVTP